MQDDAARAKRAAFFGQNRPIKEEPDDLPHKRPALAIDPALSLARVQSAPDMASTKSTSDHSLLSGSRNRMPYFRWLGPTAIMPGFKQMVVKVKRSDTDMARSSTDGIMSPSLNAATAEHGGASMFTNTPAAVESDLRTPLNLPFYDTSPVPPSELIMHLANTFFTHLGCNYPFLQRERFLRDLEEKQVDPVLVDAVCALAARFSTHSLLRQQPHEEAKATPAEYGHAFAQRAKTALVDIFACPSVAAVQAALLLAYNEFGESRDSGLWMYLGIAIRMAQDLGMHKLQGLRYRGIAGPTPKMFKRQSVNGNRHNSDAAQPKASAKVVAGPDQPPSSNLPARTRKEIDEQQAVEQERVDTFWAVFFLDRVVSSGTGRRSTLRDKEIEISFPDLAEKHLNTDWPAVFPALIRIVHLYGRVADLLNSFQEPADITPDTGQRLAAMESQVTQFYQGLSPRLHFDAVNFQHYMKAGEGTNFVLLHFWFHTLIVLLHQPTLLKTFEGPMLQLFPNSQQLSMSSAKTIADILSYSQLMDAKASLGNPFTTQPIYVAACAFLKETAEQTATSNAQSRASSPSRKDGQSDHSSSASATPLVNKQPANVPAANGKRNSIAGDQKAIAKHTLLATAASQHYQLCYKALQSLETYWAGTKYILTVLDQKFEGVRDPLLYTVEEGQSAMEQPRPEPAFTSPGWRRKLSWGPYIGTASPFLKPPTLPPVPGSPGVDPNKAIGWTLTGTMNSPSTNLAWHYSSSGGLNPQHQSTNPLAMPDFTGHTNKLNNHNRLVAPPLLPNTTTASNPDPFTRPHLPTINSTGTLSTTTPHADADLLLGLGSGYTTPAATQTFTPTANAGALQTNPYFDQANMQDFGDMMIESQDVDMSMLGLDMHMPWFNAYPDMGSYLDGAGQAAPGAQR